MSTFSNAEFVRAFLAFNRLRPVRYFAVDVALFGLPLLVAANGEVGHLGLIALASMLLVRGSALTLDDYFDAESDAIEKPSRPIPAGMVTKQQALVLGCGMIAIAIGLGAIVGPTFVAAILLLYAILAADPLVFNKLNVPGISTIVTVTSVSMLSVMGWLVYGELTIGLLAIFAATWFWDLSHDTIGAYLDSEGDLQAGINSLGSELSKPAVGGAITLGLVLSTVVLVTVFGQGVPSIILPIVMLLATLYSVGAFVRETASPELVRQLTEWFVVGSYGWLALFYMGGVV